MTGRDIRVIHREATPQTAHADLTVQILRSIFGGRPDGIRVRLWDGTQWPDDGPCLAVIVLRHPGALRSMLLPGTEVGLAEAYIYDDFDVEGDLEAVFRCAGSLADLVLGLDRKMRVVAQLRSLPDIRRSGQPRRGPATLKGRRHSVERDNQAVRYHYDVSNDFYRLWLDRQMVYSCAYFQSEETSLDEAQRDKLDYTCRKLRLRPGQRLLDIGCGWGGLVIHAARAYGANAIGITLSRPQADLANQLIAEAGLIGHAAVQVRDYREVNEPTAYDALVSVGMFEHVGLAMLPAYFRLAFQILKPGGVFLNHGISIGTRESEWPGTSFTQLYVFPDGELVRISDTLKVAEEAGFEVRDVESLREHYALTLRHWVRRLEHHHEAALAFVDEPTYRVWRLFMSGSAHGFTTGGLNVHQTLLVKLDEHGGSRFPLTRLDWYHSPPPR